MVANNLFIGSLVMIVVVAVIVTVILIALKDDDSSTEQIVKYVATGVPVIGSAAYPAGSKSLLYSYDGSSWIKTSSSPGFYDETERFPGSNVAYGNNDWVAVGRNKKTDTNILYSNNGKDWVAATRRDGVSPFYNTAGDVYPAGSGIFYSTEQNLWVAVGKSDNNNNILYSSNGKTWDVATMLSDGSSFTMTGGTAMDGGTAVVYSNDINSWVVVGKSTDDTNNILFSNNGISWQTTTTTGASPFSGHGGTSSANFGGKGIAVGVSNGIDIFAAIGLDNTSNLIVSTNGVEWERKTATLEDGSSFFGGISAYPVSITYNKEDNLWVAVGQNDNNENNIIYSTDLSNWKTASITGGISPFGGGYIKDLGGRKVIYSETNNLWLAAGDGGVVSTEGTNILTSSNGISWNNTAMTTGTCYPFGNDTQSIAFGIASRN